MKKKNDALDSLIYTFGYILYLLSQWVVSILIVNVSGLDDAGYFGLAMTVTSVFYMIASYGIRSYQISDLKPLFTDEDYVTARIVTSAVGFFCCVFYSLICGYNEKQLIVISLYMLFKCCEALYDVLHGIWQKGSRLSNVGMSLIVKAAVGIAAFVIPYVITKDLVLGLVVMTASAALLLIFDYRYTVVNFRTFESSRSSSAAVIRLLKATFVMMILIMCAPIIPAIPRIILERVDGREILGIYTSISTPTTLISAFASTVFLPLIPKYTKAYEEKDGRSIFRLIAVSSGCMLIIGALASIAIYFFGDWAVTLVYGEAVGEYYELMHGVTFSVVLASIIMCLNNLLVGIRKLRQELTFMVLGCVLCAAFSFILVPYYSMVGAIWATVLSQGIQVIIELIYIFFLVKKLGSASSDICKE